MKLLTKLSVIPLRRTLNTTNIVILPSDSVNELRNITSRFCDVILRDDKFTSCDHNVNNMRFEFYVVKRRNKINSVFC